MMFSRNRWSVCLFLCLLQVLLPEWSLASDLEEQRVRMCGKKLSDLTIHLCNFVGGLNQRVQRRSERALGLFERRLRPREVGIVDECCRNPCSLQQLLQYCARPTTKEEESKLLARFLQVVRLPTKVVSVTRDTSKNKDNGEMEEEISAPSQLNTNGAHTTDFIFA